MSDNLLENFMRVREDPWEFAKQCVYTQDQIDLKNPIKKFPAHFDYLKLYFRVWQRERLLAVPKSRRMFLSWATLILYLHDTMFNIGRQQAVVSRKEDDADDLLNRMVFILDNIPKDMFPPGVIPKYKKTYCQLDFPEIDSRILAFPSGADQLRSYAASGILGDESAFWPEAEKMYAATFPIIETKGRMTMISSAAPGFFKKLVFDEFDDSPKTEKDFIEKKFPMEGIELWKNPRNKFTVFQIHYTASPDKRSGEYRDAMKSGMPISKFNQEYEISWDTFEGKVVYPDWNKNTHGSKEIILPHVGLPLFIGVDFGLTPSAAICQLQGSQLVVLREVVTENMGAERFTELLKRTITNHYPGWSDTKEDVIMYVDPAGFAKSQSDETTCAQKLMKYFRPRPGAITWEERRTAVESFLCKIAGGVPSFKVNLSTCKILTGGFDGGYHFKEEAFEVEPNKVRPLKNEYSHIHDALQYVCSGIVGNKRGRVVRIPEPDYNFR
jgi:hypothetical protein